VTTIAIEWPERTEISVDVIEDWFIKAVSESLVPPGRLTPPEMAKELEKIGWIVLPTLTKETESESE